MRTLSAFFKKMTDTSNGGKHLPWIVRVSKSYMDGYSHDKYWNRREKVVNPQSNTNALLKMYYLFWIKRVDCRHHCSFGTSYNTGAQFVTPPLLPHGPNGIIVGADAKIGTKVTIYHQVTIPAGGVSVGDNTTLYPGVKILQGVEIGNNCRIGANAVVCEDIPNGATVVPQKARIILR